MILVDSIISVFHKKGLPEYEEYDTIKFYSAVHDTICFTRYTFYKFRNCTLLHIMVDGRIQFSELIL